MSTMTRSTFGNLRFPVAFLLLVLCLTSGAFAQSTSTIYGSVKDSSGAMVPNAKVTATNNATQLAFHSQTDASGNYQITGISPGKYKLEVSAAQLQTQVVESLTVDVSKNVPANFTLAVQSTKEVVSVTVDTPMIESSTMTVGQVIDEKVVQEIPLNGRHFVDLGLLVPGSVTAPQAGFLTAPLRGQGASAFNTAGQREDTTNYMINGVNLNDMVQNQITFQPSINTVAEFKVDNQTYSAEYGRNSGAIVNIATRSGSNAFHGEAFDFLRNEDLDARNYFQTIGIKAPFKRNNFGGAIGGPIRKDHTFFFFSYEGTRQVQSVPFLSKVLTTAERAAVTDPLSQKLLTYIPAANLGTNQFSGIGSAPVNVDQWTIDVDHKISDRDHLHGYYAHQHDKRQEPNLQGDTVPGFGDRRQGWRQIGTLNEVHTFTSAVVNEARVGMNRIHITFDPMFQIAPSSIGLSDFVSTAIGIPQITINSLGMTIGGPAGFPQGRTDTTMIFSDTLSLLRGNHAIHVGGEIRRFQNDNFAGDIGSATFTNQAAFATGSINSFSITPGFRPSRIFTTSIDWFVQDSWKMTRRFTLEAGLRYDFNGTPSEGANRFVVFDKPTSSLIQVGQGVSKVYQQDKSQYGPRLGFAWDIFGSGKTVMRAGYGLAYDQPVTNSVTPLASNPPLALPRAFTSSVGTPTMLFSNVGTLLPGSGTINAINPNFTNSYVQSYNLNFQHQWSSTMSSMIGYFGSKGTHLRLGENINQLIPLGSATRPYPTTVIPGVNNGNPVKLGNITEIESVGNSNYNALWVTADKRFSKGLQFNTSYTWSKSLDFNSLSSDPIRVQNSLNPRGDYGPSDFDARHRVVANIIYALPFSGNRLKNGWQVSTIATWQTGNPIANLIASGLSGLTGLATLRPDLLGPIKTTGNPAQWFANPVVCDPSGLTASAICTSSSVFAIPNANVGGKSVTTHFGNMRRGAVYGPGFTNTDFSLIKKTKITERFSHELRIEAFDIFNHPNFGQPGRLAAVGSTSFGIITSTRFPTGDAGSARQLQVAMKLIF